LHIKKDIHYSLATEDDEAEKMSVIILMILKAI